jgi:tripartite-type tricarboxylate transporter receptor subunit TctC
MNLPFFALLVLALLGGANASAQGDVRGPVKVLSGFAAGGPPDIVLRRIAARLEQQGLAIVVENRPGAAGTIAATAVARAEPDGRTLLFGVAANLAVAPATFRNPPYEPTQAFTPIIEVARGPYVLLVRSDAPAATLPEFVTWARATPGRLNYASPGPGTVHHIATEALKQALGVDLQHVPYRTGLYQALLAGEVHMLLESLPGPLPHLEAGKLRALAVTGERRLARLPEVPTLRELGVPDVDANSWWGFVGPAGMPRPLVDQLHREIRQALADPELVQTLRQWGIERSSGTPEDFGRYIALENQRWKARIASMKLQLN